MFTLFRVRAEDDRLMVGEVVYSLPNMAEYKKLALTLQTRVMPEHLSIEISQKTKRKLLEVIANEPHLFSGLFKNDAPTANQLIYLFCFPRHVGREAFAYGKTSSSRELERIKKAMAMLADMKVELSERNDFLPLYLPNEISSLHRGDAYLRRADAYFEKECYAEALRDYKIANQFKLHQAPVNWERRMHECYFYLGIYSKVVADLKAEVDAFKSNQERYQSSSAQFQADGLEAIVKYVVCLIEHPVQYKVISQSVYQDQLRRVNLLNPLYHLMFVGKAGFVLISNRLAERLIETLSSENTLFDLWLKYDGSQLNYLLKVLHALSRDRRFGDFITSLKSPEGLGAQFSEARLIEKEQAIKDAVADLRAEINGLVNLHTSAKVTYDPRLFEDYSTLSSSETSSHEEGVAGPSTPLKRLSRRSYSASSSE